MKPLRFILTSLLLVSTLAFGQLSDILRPTTDVDPGNVNYGCVTGGNQASSAMPKSYDAAGLATSSSLFVVGDNNGPHTKTRLFSSWAATTNSYTALSLNINAALFTDGAAKGCVKYSTDGGNTYNSVFCGTVNLQQTFTFALSTTQDLTKLRVGACTYGGKGNFKAEVDPGDANVQIFDIWTVGTNPAPATGNGSTAGQAHRGIVVSN